jgi:hypothetical protein
MNYNNAIAGVETGSQYAYRNVWPSPAAIVLNDGEVQYWLETSQGAYNATPADKAATDWILAPFDGSLPPR